MPQSKEELCAGQNGRPAHFAKVESHARHFSLAGDRLGADEDTHQAHCGESNLIPVPQAAQASYVHWQHFALTHTPPPLPLNCASQCSIQCKSHQDRSSGVAWSRHAPFATARGAGGTGGGPLPGQSSRPCCFSQHRQQQQCPGVAQKVRQLRAAWGAPGSGHRFRCRL